MQEMQELFAPGFKARPWWWEAAEPEGRDTPLPDRVTVAVVGGGYAGLSAALTLRRLGHEVAVLDAERIGWGASSRNGGMVSGGLKVASAGLAQRYGEEKARHITQAAAASFPFIEETIAREGIDCDYVRCGRYVGAWSRGHHAAMAKKADWIAELTGLPTEMIPKSRQREFLGSDHANRARELKVGVGNARTGNNDRFIFHLFSHLFSGIISVLREGRRSE